MRIALTAAILSLLSPLGILEAAFADSTTSCVSVDIPGARNPSITPDGLQVVFDSGVTGQAYVRDLQSGTTELVSISSSGDPANDENFRPAISGNGRFVAFTSRAFNLVAGDSPGTWDAFLHDRVTGKTSLLVESTFETGGAPWNLTFSANSSASIVAFSAVIPNDTFPPSREVYVLDVESGALSRVSSVGSSEPLGGDQPSISASGRYVAFVSGNSPACGVPPGNTGFPCSEIFVHDRQTGETQRVSVSTTGGAADGGAGSPSISGDGRYVAFESAATNLVPFDTNGGDIFVHDRLTGLTERVSVSSTGQEANGGSATPAISQDGRFVAFGSAATNLVSDDSAGQLDIFVHDRLTRTTERVSVSSTGEQGNNDSWVLPISSLSISSNGSRIAFTSGASNFVPCQVDGWTMSVFLRDRDADGDGIILPPLPLALPPAALGAVQGET